MKNKLKNIDFNALSRRRLLNECGVFYATDHFFFSNRRDDIDTRRR